MSGDKMTPAEVEQRMVSLLGEIELCYLSTLSADSTPMCAPMYFANDGLVLYLHFLGQTRKSANIARNPTVGYAVHRTLPGGFDERMQMRSIQMTGRASILRDMADIHPAIELMHKKMPWLQKMSLLSNFEHRMERGMQMIVRIDPIEALWADASVNLLYRTMVKFEDGHATRLESP